MNPTLRRGYRSPGENLVAYDVRVHPSLSLSVQPSLYGTEEKYISEIDASIDVARQTMFVSSPAVLPHVDGGGRALATLFEGNARRLAQAWRGRL